MSGGGIRFSFPASDLALELLRAAELGRPESIELDARDLHIEARDRSIIITSHSRRSRHQKHLQTEAATGIGKDAARAMSDTIPRSFVEIATGSSARSHFQGCAAHDSRTSGRFLPNCDHLVDLRRGRARVSWRKRSLHKRRRYGRPRS